jgi:electron transport complex protein RnfB
MSDLARRIDALLPQTQCTRCGYQGCLPYAEAIARGEADIDQCPPGGDEGVARLAALLGRAAKPLDPAFGAWRPPQVAVIDEARCIGCVKCIDACPVDAIVGAAKMMHTVIAAWCTGCELCIPPCPTDCIALVPAGRLPEPDLSRKRHAFRAMRLARDEAEHAARMDSYARPAEEPASNP